MPETEAEEYASDEIWIEIIDAVAQVLKRRGVGIESKDTQRN